ncbi:MAG: hypothetical protein GXP56_06915 [Deltaproteobacteria bacterium]|nr:hypothetical protein [Deltaproteobacteria bacterium]
MGHYIRQSLEKVKKEFGNSNIKLEIEYRTTKNVAEYRLIYSQSIRPGTVVTTKKPEIKTATFQVHFSRLSLIKGGSHERNPFSQSRTTPAYTSYPVHYNAQRDVVLKLKVYHGKG